MTKPKKSTKKFLSRKNGSSKLSDAISRRKQLQAATKRVTKKKRSRPDHDPEDEEQAQRVKVLSRTDAAEDDDGKDDGLGDNVHMDGDEDAMKESSDEEETALLAGEDGESDDDMNEETYKQQLQALEKSDPEFFKYLKENDKSLFDFDIDNDEDDAMMDAEDEGEDKEENEMMEAEEGHRNVLTAEMVEEWKRQLTQTKSMKHLKNICVAFRNAIATISGDDKTPRHSYAIDDPSVFNLLMLSCLREVPDAFIHHLYGDKVDADSASTSSMPSSKSKWPKLKTLIKIHIKALLAFLNHASDESMIEYALLHSEKMVGFVACFPKLCKDWMKVLMHQWATGSSKLRVRAFLGVRKLALVSAGMLEQCLKQSYTKFIASCGVVNAHTITDINFMLNCMVELCGMNEASTYHNAFVYIRQLAIQLRGALMNPTKEAYKKVYNWQYYYCLKLWAQVLSTHAAGSATRNLSQNRPSSASATLQPLIYPLVQIILGVIRLKPSSKYLPLRFNLVRVLINLSKATGYFIPIASLLLEVFEMSDVKSKGRPSIIKPMDWTLNIKIGKTYLGTRPYQTDVVNETMDLLFEYYSISAMSIAFPEIALPTVLHLRRMMKSMSTSQHHLQHKKAVHDFVQKLEENMKFIEKHRSNIDFGPNDTIQANAFLSDLDPGGRKFWHVRHKLPVV